MSAFTDTVLDVVEGICSFIAMLLLFTLFGKAFGLFTWIEGREKLKKKREHWARIAEQRERERARIDEQRERDRARVNKARYEEGMKMRLERRRRLRLPSTATERECRVAERNEMEKERREAAKKREEAAKKREEAAEIERESSRRRRLGLPSTATEDECLAAERNKREEAAKKREEAAKAAAAKKARAAEDARAAKEKAKEIAVDKGYLLAGGEPLVYSERVHDVTQNFLIRLAEFDGKIRKGETFSFEFDAHIKDGESLSLFVYSAKEILEEKGLFGRSMFEHNGLYANSDDGSTYQTVTGIRYLLLSDSDFPNCPCCESCRDVRTIQDTDEADEGYDMLRYKCLDVCELSFRRSLYGEITWDMAHPVCETCGDNEDVEPAWGECCQAKDYENEHGCGPFQCSACDEDNPDGHFISTDGECVDPDCECHEWPDDD